MIIKATEKYVDYIVPLGEQFAKNSKFVRFKTDVAIKNIKNIIKNDIGVLFFYVVNDKLVGMICGIKHPDFLTGEMTATEIFWYVDENHRGIGQKLLDRFERWAKEEGCKQIIMVHLSDSMPDKVVKIYKHRGYKYLESHFIKGI